MEGIDSLVAEARGGNLTAYGSLVRRYQDMAVGYAYSILGDFHRAAEQGHLEAAKTLVAHGADISLRDRLYDGTAAGWAHHCGHPEVHDYLQSQEK